MGKKGAALKAQPWLPQSKSRWTLPIMKMQSVKYIYIIVKQAMHMGSDALFQNKP